MKQDNPKNIKNEEIPIFIQQVHERMENAIQYINLTHMRGETDWRIVLDEAIFYYVVFEDKSVSFPIKDYADFKALQKKDSKPIDGMDVYVSGYTSQYNTLYKQLQIIFNTFSVSFEQVFRKQSGHQLNSAQYRFIYELLARRNNIFVWRKILKEYNFSYNGFLELYYKIDDADREPLINELRFIVDGLTAIKEPTSLPAAEFKNHLLAVTQLPLIEIAHLSREIVQIDMDEVMQHPMAFKLFEFYNKNINELNKEIKKAIGQANQKWSDFCSNCQCAASSSPLIESLTERMVLSMKKADNRFSSVTTIDEFHKIEEKIKAEQTITENKKLDDKIQKLVMEFLESLTFAEQSVLCPMVKFL